MHYVLFLIIPLHCWKKESCVQVSLFTLNIVWTGLIKMHIVWTVLIKLCIAAMFHVCIQCFEPRMCIVEGICAFEMNYLFIMLFIIDGCQITSAAVNSDTCHSNPIHIADFKTVIDLCGVL